MTAPAPEPIPAATLVVFRQARAAPLPEILMIERAPAMRFAGGMAAFPGGRVDPADRALAAALPGADADGDMDDTAHRIAAIRETLEETGLALGLAPRPDHADAAALRAGVLASGALAPALARGGWEARPDALVPFARWLPLGLAHARIFDTRFYLADIGTGAVELAADATETARLFWITARGALEMAERGEIGLIFPTRRNLERLAQFASFAEARAHAEATPPVTITPWIDEGADPPLLRIPDGAGYPVTAQPYAEALRA